MPVYAIQAAGPGNPIKIGYAADPVERMQALQRTFPFDLTLLAVSSKDDKAGERPLHRTLMPYRIRGEWFRPTSEVMQAIEGMRANGLSEVLIADRWLTPHRRLIASHGGPTGFAELTGFNRNWVESWKANGLIPAKYHAEVIRGLRAAGRAVSPSDFFPPDCADFAPADAQAA